MFNSPGPEGGQVPPRARQISDGTRMNLRYCSFRKVMVNSLYPEHEHSTALHLRGSKMLS